jgi:hypothetical protein
VIAIALEMSLLLSDIGQPTTLAHQAKGKA